MSASWVYQLLPQLLMNPMLYLHNVVILNICIKEFGAKNFFGLNDSNENFEKFLIYRLCKTEGQASDSMKALI